MKFALCCFLLNLNSVWHQITVVQSRSLLLKIHLHRYRYIDSRHSKHPPRKSLIFPRFPGSFGGGRTLYRLSGIRAGGGGCGWISRTWLSHTAAVPIRKHHARCCTLAAMPNRGCLVSWPLGWVKCEFLEDQEVGIVSTMGVDFGDLINSPRASFLIKELFFFSICRLPNPINPIPLLFPNGLVSLGKPTIWPAPKLEDDNDLRNRPTSGFSWFSRIEPLT